MYIPLVTARELIKFGSKGVGPSLFLEIFFGRRRGKLMGDLVGKEGIRTQLCWGVEFLPSAEDNDTSPTVATWESMAKRENTF